MIMIRIAIFEDGVPSGTFTADQIRAANPDCPEVDAALRCIEAGAYQADIELGAGGKTTLIAMDVGRVVGCTEHGIVRAALVGRYALASYRGTLADVRAASDRDVAELELVDATEGRR
jgi:hypothetical protein